jgi:hypothetical protein
MKAAFKRKAVDEQKERRRVTHKQRGKAIKKQRSELQSEVAELGDPRQKVGGFSGSQCSEALLFATKLV